ncbi:hypothetical protein, partial [Psychrobacillus vulpis]|uniref:hypothetical protein n=1 Tax=Psychrobacillus vulpis TaxID=2325572 RepID=UPI0019811FBE
GEKGNFSFKIERKIVFFDGEYIKKLKAKVFQCPPFPRALPQSPRYAAGPSTNAIPAGVSLYSTIF